MCQCISLCLVALLNRIFREVTLLNRAIGEILKHVNRQGTYKISVCRVVDSVYFGWRWMMTLSVVVSISRDCHLTIACTCMSARVLHMQQLNYWPHVYIIGYWAYAWPTYMKRYNFSSLRNGSSTCALFLIWSSFESGHVKVGYSVVNITRGGSNYLYKPHKSVFL